MNICVQRYRAVRRKLRSKPEAERETELIRILRAADVANREVYARLRKSRLNQEAVEMILNACHLAAELPPASSSSPRTAEGSASG
jgi:hypothetical protein